MGIIEMFESFIGKNVVKDPLDWAVESFVNKDGIVNASTGLVSVFKFFENLIEKADDRGIRKINPEDLISTVMVREDILNISKETGGDIVKIADSLNGYRAANIDDSMLSDLIFSSSVYSGFIKYMEGMSDDKDKRKILYKRVLGEIWSLTRFTKLFLLAMQRANDLDKELEEHKKTIKSLQEALNALSTSTGGDEC